MSISVEQNEGDDMGVLVMMSWARSAFGNKAPLISFCRSGGRQTRAYRSVAPFRFMASRREGLDKIKPGRYALGPLVTGQKIIDLCAQNRFCFRMDTNGVHGLADGVGKGFIWQWGIEAGRMIDIRDGYQMRESGCRFRQSSAVRRHDTHTRRHRLYHGDAGRLWPKIGR